MAVPARGRGAAARARLLRVAAALIVERGWGAVTTRTLAARAEVTPSAVRYHFASLPVLLAEAVTTAMSDLFDQITPALELASSPRAVLAMLLGFLQEDNEHPRTSLLFTEAYLAATRDEPLRRALNEVLARFQHRLAVVLAIHGVRAPEATAAVLGDAIDAVMLHQQVSRGIDTATAEDILHRLLTPPTCMPSTTRRNSAR